MHRPTARAPMQALQMQARRRSSWPSARSVPLTGRASARNPACVHAAPSADAKPKARAAKTPLQKEVLEASFQSKRRCNRATSAQTWAGCVSMRMHARACQH